MALYLIVCLTQTESLVDLQDTILQQQLEIINHQSKPIYSTARHKHIAILYARQMLRQACAYSHKKPSAQIGLYGLV